VDRDYRVSVIVPAYNAEDTIGQCLEALDEQTHPPDEVIVVDDGSTDRTVDVSKEFGARVVSQPNSGPAGARNRGAAMARGEILLFTDADCEPTPDWVEKMVTAFKDPEVVGAKGAYETRQRSLLARFVQLEYEDKCDQMQDVETIDFVDTYSAGYRRGVFRSVGGFDGSFRVDEDQELSFRLAKRGHKLVFVPGARVFHRHVTKLRDYARRKFWIGYWKARVVQAHPGKLKRDSHTPQRLKVQIGLAGLGGMLLAGGGLDTRLAVAGLTVWGLLLLSAMPLLIKIWRRDRGVLLVAPAMLFLRAWTLGAGFLVGSIWWSLVDGR